MNMVFKTTVRTLAIALHSLRRRSLIEKHKDSFTLQNVILEYTTRRFIDHIIAELESGELHYFRSHPLIKAEAEEHIRQNQIRQILTPVIQECQIVKNLSNEQELIKQLLDLGQVLRTKHPSIKIGYSLGNILNNSKLIVDMICADKIFLTFQFGKLIFEVLI